jgi:cyclohexanone monooxygenase
MDWEWKERYPQQAEVEVYLNKIADHLELRKDVQLNTTVTAAHRDEKHNLWTVSTSDGAQYTCTYLVAGTGPLATPIKPPFPGLDTFKGEWFQTGIWPAKKIDFANKRVAVIGTGATAVQVIPIVAHSAKHLTVFQRTPNYVIPGRNHPLLPHQTEEILRDYPEIKQRAMEQTWGFDMMDSKQMYDAIKEDPAEVQRILEGGWEKGGFRYFFETFADLLISDESNREIAEFIRRKIKAIVKDPKTAELLCPQYPVVTKRPPLGHNYYEAYNRPNVRLVNIKNDPIQDVTTTGLKTGSEEFEFDMIIFALGKIAPR